MQKKIVLFFLLQNIDLNAPLMAIHRSLFVCGLPGDCTLDQAFPGGPAGAETSFVGFCLFMAQGHSAIILLNVHLEWKM